MATPRLLFVDTETGGCPKNGEKNNYALLQISAVVTEPTNAMRIRSYFTSYIKPPAGLICSPGAESIHGITRESLQNEPDEQMVAEAFVAFCQANYPLRFAGYNCSFDLNFVDAMVQRHQVFLPEFETPYFDVLALARDQLKDVKNHKLVTVREYFGMPTDGAHDAACDIYDTIVIARNLRRMKLATA